MQQPLTAYDGSYNGSWWMLNAVNDVYMVLFHGPQVPAFVTAVERDPGVLRTLFDFAGSHLELLGGEQSYLASNAGRELGRFLQHASLRAEANPLVRGIHTNNGGMHLEGDPSMQGNQPRFIAYEAEWRRPEFAIWNLDHEYTHHLDGRFTMHGDFEAGISTPTVWWIEGFAEYVSYGYRKLPCRKAAAEAGKHTYRLSTLFDTTYDADTGRVYRWGYLAVRYMLENHRADRETVLSGTTAAVTGRAPGGASHAPSAPAMTRIGTSG
ncbi:hypothetical protein FHS42_000335 [Streptomyces zagrosensis]|uniref:Uncharacterized protein n=1 Tax=Streptomyces zagrosensis TaxID=1042984 RepID=A0A7W9UW98_9ACTN|nr:hypothetical protein [Streptomyces zagrosensis]